MSQNVFNQKQSELIIADQSSKSYLVFEYQHSCLLGLPMENVLEINRINKNFLKERNSEIDILSDRGDGYLSLSPLEKIIDLKDEFDGEIVRRNSTSEVNGEIQFDLGIEPKNLVTLSYNGEKFFFEIGEIISYTHLSLQPLNKFVDRVRIFSGVAILRNGVMVLALNLVTLSKRVNQKNGGFCETKQRKTMTGQSNSLRESILAFDLGTKYHFGILIQQVKELRELKIDYQNGGVVKSISSEMPMIDLSRNLGIQSKRMGSQEFKLAVIVVHKGQEYALLVEKFLDIISIPLKINHRLLGRPGFLGSLIHKNKVYMIINPSEVVEIYERYGNLFNRLGFLTREHSVIEMSSESYL